MRTSASVAIATFCSLVIALPTTNNILTRAGGPAIVPIPSTCTVTNPMPADSSDSGVFYQPTVATNPDILYYAYYPSFSTNKTAMAEQCLQQCYGYGYHTECKTAFWAENLVVPAGYYGTPGGQLETGCIFFTRALTVADFTEAPEGQATSAFAGTIAC